MDDMMNAGSSMEGGNLVIGNSMEEQQEQHDKSVNAH